MIEADPQRAERPDRVMTVSDRLIWERDGGGWPHREASQLVSAAGISWHVQRMGHGPQILLVHGTGASSHSWASVAALLARSYTVIVPDLPGHAFTEALPQRQMSLPGMAAALSQLLLAMNVTPVLAAGHSAGAAILSRMSLQGRLGAPIVSVNGAFLPFGGIAGQIFTPMAKLLVQSSAMSQFFAWRARQPEVIERLLQNTGSHISRESTELYARLVGNPHHVAGALAMMANWDLAALERDLPQLKARLILVVATNDQTVKPDDAFRVRDRVPGSRVVLMRGLGHLAHEEDPEGMARILISVLENASSEEIGHLRPRAT